MRGAINTSLTAALVLGLMVVGPLFAAASERPEADRKINIPIVGEIPEEFKKAGSQEYDVHFGTLTARPRERVGHTHAGTQTLGGTHYFRLARATTTCVESFFPQCTLCRRVVIFPLKLSESQSFPF